MATDQTADALTLLAAAAGDSAFGTLAQAFVGLGSYASGGLLRQTAQGYTVLATFPLPQAYDDEPPAADAALAEVLAAPAAKSVALPAQAFWRAGEHGAAASHLNGIAIRDDDGRALGAFFHVGPATTDFVAHPALPLLLRRAAAELRELAVRESARRTAELYRRALELAGERVLLHDRHGILTELSDGEPPFWPHRHECLLGGHYASQVPPALAERFAAAQQAVLSSGNPCLGEYEIDFPDGPRAREIHIACFDRDHTVSVIRDVTESRQSSSALRESEARLRAMLDAMPDTLLVNDADGVYVEQPVVARGAWAYVQQDARGRRFEEVLPAAVAARLRAAHTEVMALGEPRSGEYGIELEGQVWQREFRMVRLGADRTLTIVRDVTELKAALDALRDSESRLRKVVALAPVGIFWTDPQGAVRYGNPALRRSLALSAQEGLGHAWVNFLHADDEPRVAAAWRRLVDGETAEFVEEYRFVPPDRPPRHVRTHAVPIVSDGHTIGLMGIVLDLTELRVDEEQRQRLHTRLQQLQKNEALGQLTGGIAHEFNNLLASTLGYASLLLRRLPAQADPKLADYARQIVDAGERGRDLVQRMLTFAQRSGDSGSTATLATSVADVVQMLRTALPSTLKLQVLIEPGVPSVTGSTDDLRQVVLNLALNARDAIIDDDPMQRGTIGIAVYGPRRIDGVCHTCKELLQGEHVVIDVTDDGSGIDTAALARIFDPFYTRKAVGGGTGLGLSVVHGIVHRDGGHVLVESSLQKGSRFRVLLRAAAESAPADVGKVPAGPSSRAGARVLVVDDEPAVGAFVAELLASEGYTVDLHTDARVALAAACAAPDTYALVVTDLSMPKLSGLELAAALLARHPALPVFACSGYDDAVDSDTRAAPGIVRWFRKPLPIAEFLDAVASVVRARPPR